MLGRARLNLLRRNVLKTSPGLSPFYLEGVSYLGGLALDIPRTLNRAREVAAFKILGSWAGPLLEGGRARIGAPHPASTKAPAHTPTSPQTPTRATCPPDSIV